ncbi:MAG: DUF933 domain-containing protein [Thermaerobacterales bacterium]
MKVGLIGLPGAGKSSLFKLLTGTDSQATATRSHSALAAVPDARLDALVGLYSPPKITPATFEVVDMPSMLPGSEGAATARVLETIADADAFLHVVRAFKVGAPHPLGDIDPRRDAATLTDELLLADWSLITTRLERLQSSRKRPPNHAQESAFFSHLSDHLEQHGNLEGLAFDDEQAGLLRQYPLFTLKPALLLLNIAEDQIGSPPEDLVPGLDQWAADHRAPVVMVSAQVESEIALLGPEDRPAFMEELGLAEPGTVRVATGAYHLLDRISFLTAGPKEVRAWSIPSQSTAKRAGRAIHSDIERGFIRAEVVSCPDLLAAGSMAEARKQGTVRLEGRKYIVQDGDVIEFLFNV